MNRQGFLGGSDAAAVLGVSPWTTPYALWEEKTSAIASETSPDRELAFRWGKRLEPVVIDMLTEDYEVNITARNAVHTDKEMDFLRAEIDFEYFDDPITGNGDVKTVHPYAAVDWGEPGSDEVPTYYVAQFQHGMMVTGRVTCMVAALIGSTDLRVYHVHRDNEIIAMLRERESDFWHKNVLGKVAPPLRDASDARKMLSRFDGITVVATDEMRETARRLKGVKDAIKRLSARETAYSDALKIAIANGIADGDKTADKTALVDASGKPIVTWNLQMRAGYTVAPTTCRILLLKGKNLL